MNSIEEISLALCPPYQPRNRLRSVQGSTLADVEECPDGPCFAFAALTWAVVAAKVDMSVSAAFCGIACCSASGRSRVTLFFHLGLLRHGDRDLCFAWSRLATKDEGKSRRAIALGERKIPPSSRRFSRYPCTLGVMSRIHLAVQLCHPFLIDRNVSLHHVSNLDLGGHRRGRGFLLLASGAGQQ